MRERQGLAMAPTLEEIRDRWGTATPLPLPGRPEFAALAQHWLVTAPSFDAVWSQYYLSATRVDATGLGSLGLIVPGATHKITIQVLIPAAERRTETPETLARYWTPGDPMFGRLPELAPSSVAVQITATDAEAELLLPILARAIVSLAWAPFGILGNTEMVQNLWTSGIASAIRTLRAS